MFREKGAGVGVVFGVLGPVVAWDDSGDVIDLKGPRHRAVPARLIVARGRVVPVSLLAEDLWTDPPSGALGAIRTFVGVLRRALEPDRPPRAPARLLVTRGPGYALHAEPDAVDAWRFERAVAETAPPGIALERLEEALGWWRGPSYAEFADEPWARAERSRLAELRLHAVERLAEARLDLGLAAEAVPDLDAAARLDGAGMPGLEHGLPPLALLSLRIRHALPVQTDEHTDWGPYEPWTRPLVLLAQDRREEAATALRETPDPPCDLLFEAMWCLTARAAVSVGDTGTMERAHRELTPAASELAGAGSGLLTLGPVSRYLDDLSAALAR